MPTSSLLRQNIKDLDERLEELTQILACTRSPQLCRLYNRLAEVRRRFETMRYWDRHPVGPGYRPSEYTHSMTRLMAYAPNQHKHMFRMSSSELEALVRLYGDHPVFVSTGRKPQAPAAYQLGAFVIRLAHGHDLKTLRVITGFSGELGDRLRTDPLHRPCRVTQSKRLTP